MIPLRFRTVAWTIAAYLIAALPHLAAMPVWLAGTILAACGWRLTAAWHNWRPPHWIVRTSLTVLGVLTVIAAYGTLWGRRAATGLLCVMIAAKLMETFRLRDARMVASLGFFLVASQFLFSQRLVFLGYLLIACWVVTVALHVIEHNDEAPTAGAAPPGRLAWLDGVRGGAVLLVAAIPVALVLFALFPRLAQPLWGVPDHVLDGRTGLSETMSPGSIASLFVDDSPAFRVEFNGPIPEFQDRYWRGPVLWHFDGATWRRHFFSTRPADAVPAAGPEPYRYRVQLEPNEQRWLFSLDYPARWPDAAILTSDYQLLSKRPVTGLVSYEVVSEPDFTDSPVLFDTLRRAALDLPAGRNPRTLGRAAELRRQHEDDRDLIRAVLDWFNTDQFFYSLETAPLGRHGADEFLFDVKTGYCEYYASAFVILMRAAGIPARIVTGYQGGFWQRNGAYMLIRQSDAHAWAEVWLPESGWTRVDPTAAVSPTRITDGARQAVDSPRMLLDLEWVYRMRNRYDRLQHLWNRWILDFDAARQQRVLSRLGLSGLGPLGHSGVLIAALAVVMGPLAFLLWRRRVLAPAQSADQRAWRRLQARLTRRGLRPQVSETPLEYAHRVALELANGDELVELAFRFSQIHYGNARQAGPASAAEFRHQARRWRPVVNFSTGAAVKV